MYEQASELYYHPATKSWTDSPDGATLRINSELRAIVRASPETVIERFDGSSWISVDETTLTPIESIEVQLNHPKFVKRQARCIWVD